MAQAIFTVMVRIRPGRKETLEAHLRSLDYRGVAPISDPLGLGTIDALHFCSFFLYDDPQDGWSLVFESNIDGRPGDYFDALVKLDDPAKQKAWDDIFQHCRGFEGQFFSRYSKLWTEHIQKPSAQYVGAVGRSRRQILLEAAVRGTVEATLSASPGLAPGEAAKAVRAALLSDANTAEFAAHVPRPVDRSLWLWTVLGLSTLAGVGLIAAVIVAIVDHSIWAITALSIVALGVIAFIAALRWLENGASEDVSRPDVSQVRDIAALEDFLPTNHMVSVVHLHHDWFRAFLRRTISWVLNVGVYLVAYRGTLGPIPTIHFAHWSIVNGGRRLMFVSNFDGSWQSYLDDFTLKAAKGLTLAWIFGVGFPRTRWLLGGGAARAEAFIDWARRSMVPSLVWYMAYPGLSTTRINENSELRRLIAADTDNSGKWLERL